MTNEPKFKVGDLVRRVNMQRAYSIKDISYIDGSILYLLHRRMPIKEKWIEYWYKESELSHAE